jgi:hypothetical protein
MARRDYDLMIWKDEEDTYHCQFGGTGCNIYSSLSLSEVFVFAFGQLPSGGIIKLRSGTYVLDAGIIIPAYVQIRGAGMGTRIEYSGSGAMFTFPDYWSILSDVWLYQTGGTTQGTAIVFDVSYNCVVQGVKVDSSGEGSEWEVGILFEQDEISQSGNNTVRDCLINLCERGMVDNARTNFVMETTFQNCSVCELDIWDGGNHYQNCTFGYGSPLAIHGRPSSGGTPSQGAVFLGCWIENVPQAMNIEGGRMFTYRDGWIHCTSESGPTVEIDDVQGGGILNCIFVNETGNGTDILLNNSYSIEIANCFSLSRFPTGAIVVSVTGNPTTAGHIIRNKGNNQWFPGSSLKLGAAGAGTDFLISRPDYGYGFAFKAVRNDGVNYDDALSFASGHTAPEPPDIHLNGRLQVLGQLVLKVKNTAGAPDDSYGWVTGTVVFNSADNKLYIRGSSSWVAI